MQDVEGPSKAIAYEPLHEFPKKCYVQPAKSQIILPICAVLSELEYSTKVKLLTEQHLVLLSLKGGCTGSSESIHVKMPHCWKACVAA